MDDYTPIEIKCPHCGKLAFFNEPFLFYTSPAKDETRPVHQWGGWLVIEKYPTLLHWTPPKNSSNQYLRYGGGDGAGYPLMHKGVVNCPNCHINSIHTLSWPDDAWWQWEIRGKLLYAWHRAHALKILEFISATDRPGRYLYGSVGKIPTHFLTAKVREIVCAKMRQSLTD